MLQDTVAFTADRKRGLRMRNVISEGMDAALRGLVTAR